MLVNAISAICINVTGIQIAQELDYGYFNPKIGILTEFRSSKKT